MKEYKFESVSQMLSSKKFTYKVNNLLNDYSENGWDLEKMKHGWNNWLLSTLYFVFSRNKEK